MEKDMSKPNYKIFVTHTDAECTKLGWGVYKLREGSNGHYMLVRAFEEESEARENLAFLLKLEEESKDIQPYSPESANT
jgi:hypothetical protein